MRVTDASTRAASRTLDRSSFAAFEALARQYGRTTRTALCAAVLALVYRYTEEPAPTIRVRTSNDDDLADLSELRADLADDPSFTALLQRLRDPAPESVAVASATDPPGPRGRNPFSSLCFTYGDAGVARDVAGAVHVIATQTSAGCALACDYDPTLLDASTAAGLPRALETLLRSIVARPEERLSSLPLLAEFDREALVVTANQTQAVYPAQRSVLEPISQRWSQTPAALAVVCGDATLTYAQLDEASNRLARELLARELGSGCRVGVMLERSVELVVALLAVLKAGSAYVPLDPKYPRERLAFIASDSRLAGLITRSTLSERLQDAGAPVFNLDTQGSDVSRRSAEPLARADAAGPAYILYTSGSTGRPKGVEIRHAALVNVLHALSASTAFGLDARDVHVAVATIAFDIATLDVFLPLVNGARLVIATDSELADGYALHALLRRSGATFVQAPPIVWQLLLEAGWRGDPALKIHCGGEALSRQLADRLLADGNELWNGYGPTETTITSSIARVEPGPGPVLLGPPIANTQFYVVDARGQLAPHGAAGELYIGGDGVAAGYFGHPELTRKRFLPDSFRDVPGATVYRTGDRVRRHGPAAFEFLGRNDQQIKLRGFRIELGEIEAALLRQPAVREACVVVREGDGADPALCAFVVFESSGATPDTVSIASARQRLCEELPHYMVPARLFARAVLPRTPNGKLDRQALTTIAAEEAVTVPAEPADSDGFAASEVRAGLQTPTERALAQIWSETLQLERVGPEDEIFALGADSLHIFRIVARANKQGLQLTAKALMRHRTLAAVARHLDAPAVRGS